MVNSLLRNIKICWINNEIHPAEQFIIDLLKNSTTKSDTKYKVWYDQDNQWFIEQDSENDIFWLYYYKIWSFFESKYKLNYQQIQEVTKILLERHLKCKVATTRPYFRKKSRYWRDT